MKTTTNKNYNGRIEEITVITFFIILFIFTILSGNVSAQVNGNSGHCLEFNGTTSGVTVNSGDLKLNQGSTMTVTAWVKCNNTTSEGSWASIVALNNGGAGYSGDDGQFWLQHSQDNSVFEFAVESESGSKNYVQSITEPVTEQWYHVAGVYDGSYIYLYVNGILEAKTAQTGKINSYRGDFNLVFGQWANAGEAYRRFNGDIDEVTIWNVALTQTQIRAYMCQSLQGTESGLIGHWRMNETSGNKVYDVTSNKYNAVSSNTSIVWSGAPIGNASTNTFGGTHLSLNNPTYGDSLVVNTLSSTPTGIIIYRIDTMPNSTTPPAGYTSLATKYYYGVYIIGSATPTYKVSYYYTGNPEVTSSNIGGLAMRTDNTVTTWSDVAATINSSSKILQKANLSGRNEFIPAIKIIGLPISLLNFSAAPNGTVVDIKWATATEINNSFFTVERTTDGINYETVSTVKGSGNTDYEINYAATDANPVSGISYYRLRQTDFDGKSKFFEAVAVTYTESAFNSLDVKNVYPNPFGNNFSITLECNTAKTLNIEILSITGLTIDKETVSCSQGSNTYEYSKGYLLTTGTYFVSVTDPSNGQTTVKKIVKL